MNIEKFEVPVNYELTWAAAIAEGKYDVVDQMVTPIKPRSISCGPLVSGPKEVCLVSFPEGLTFGGSARILATAGLRVCRVEEALALGSQFPDLQRKLQIHILGSFYQKFIEGWWHTFLGGDATSRGIGVCQSGPAWQIPTYAANIMRVAAISYGDYPPR